MLPSLTPNPSVLCLLCVGWVTLQATGFKKKKKKKRPTMNKIQKHDTGSIDLSMRHVQSVYDNTTC